MKIVQHLDEAKQILQSTAASGFRFSRIAEQLSKMKTQRTTIITFIWLSKISCSTTRYEGAWVKRRYSSYSFSTLALNVVSGQRHASATPVPTAQETGWAPVPFWTQKLEEKSFRICRESNLDRPFVQPVAKHYTELTRFTNWISTLT
jgi:hypothetical protein